MADVLNRTTKEFIGSANTPDYPVAQWIINPDMTAVQGFPSKYWSIQGDSVLLMSQAERDQVDAVILQQTRDTTVDSNMLPLENYERAYALTALDESNLHASTISQILDAVDAATSLADLKAAVAGIANIPNRTPAQLKTAVRNKIGS